MATKYIQLSPIHDTYSLMAYNICIIGAARRVQGTGPFIARYFAHLGHPITGIVGTSETSAREAQLSLLNTYDINTQAYTSFESLCADHNPDIVVISSPADTHLSYLIKALSAGCHVFCEKPLWWPEVKAKPVNRKEYLGQIDQVIELAQDNQRLLHLNTQWPYTLKDFNRLYPNAMVNQPLQSLAMHLSPQSDGVNMLIDGASHGLSMLYQLAGKGDIDSVRMTKETGRLLVQFDFHHTYGTTRTSLGFTRSNETPKAASYQINGCLVKRLITLPGYQIKLQSDQQTIAIQDPLGLSIDDFLAGVDAELKTDELALKQGASHLYQLIEKFYKS